ncbi:MAG: TauD/TfdA family dioxygenase, partial [Actinomycetota bacterium]|nr:TauD/TfdA family dioxygenase [Actinomycetota bacterium]
ADRHESIEFDPIDIAALDAWEEIANRPEMYLEMDLKPGDMQLLSNHTIAHARTAYEDVPDGPKRHLLRLWLTV